MDTVLLERMYVVRTAGEPRPYLIDTSGLFRILQDKLRQAWSDQLTAGVIAICPIVELEFLYSARSLADRPGNRA
jgi:predicted nucleic acid-binding protein